MGLHRGWQGLPEMFTKTGWLFFRKEVKMASKPRESLAPLSAAATLLVNMSGGTFERGIQETLYAENSFGRIRMLLVRNCGRDGG
jgi:hypothetical protein